MKAHNRFTAPDNIWSGATDPLLAALTNPTDIAIRRGVLAAPVTVTDRTGKTWPSAEHAFNAYRTGALDKDVAILARIIRAKLEQHDWLREGVEQRGGFGYLKNCSHVVDARSSQWEGVGMDSPFIQALVMAWEALENNRQRA
jgi:hypothetical protein